MASSQPASCGHACARSWAGIVIVSGACAMAATVASISLNSQGLIGCAILRGRLLRGAPEQLVLQPTVLFLE